MDRKRRLVSFDVFRTLGIPGVSVLKPEMMFAGRELLAEADWVLFPEEWQINPILHTLGTRIFPSVASYRFGQDKVQFTRAMWMVAPEHMPETLILPATREGAEAAIERFGFPFVAKHPRRSMGEGVWRIENRAQLSALLGQVDVLYAQELLEIDRDLRVVWIGDRIMAAYWRIGYNGFHNNLARGGEADFSGIPDAALRLVERIAPAMGIDHAGFDLALSGGHWYLLETNVRFGNDALRFLRVDMAAAISEWLEKNTPQWQGPDEPEEPDEPPASHAA